MDRRLIDIYDNLLPLGSVDIVFSHAMLQWIDNHETIIPQRFGLLSNEGVLAVWVPNQKDTPLYSAPYKLIALPFRTLYFSNLPKHINHFLMSIFIALSVSYPPTSIYGRRNISIS